MRYVVIVSVTEKTQEEGALVLFPWMSAVVSLAEDMLKRCQLRCVCVGVMHERVDLDKVNDE